VYTQQWYMSYRFVNGFRAGLGCSILVLLENCLQTCMTYTSAFEQEQDVPSWSCSIAVYKPVWHIPQLSSWIRMFHPGRARKLSTNLYGIYLSFRAGSGCSILVVLDSCLQTCMTYTIAECTVNKLLMMDRRTVRNM